MLLDRPIGTSNVGRSSRAKSLHDTPGGKDKGTSIFLGDGKYTTREKKGLRIGEKVFYDRWVSMTRLKWYTFSGKKDIWSLKIVSTPYVTERNESAKRLLRVSVITLFLFASSINIFL